MAEEWGPSRAPGSSLTIFRTVWRVTRGDQLWRVTRREQGRED
jgi:hypothetical protein